MKAVIMAGGEGTRLRPLTSLLPKPMVPIVNQPVMEHILGLVKHHGIDEVVATLAFMPHVIEDYFGAGDEWGMTIEYAIEETPLGTAGSVKNAQKLLPSDEPFLVISGDAMTDIDLTGLITYHKDKGAAVTIALKSVSDPLDFGVVITDDDGKIERFLEKPTWGQVFSDRINTGIYVIEPWVLDLIPEGQPYDFSSELFPNLMELGHSLYGMPSAGYWCDVGSKESYMEVHRDILDDTAMIWVPGVRTARGVWVSESATIAPDATLGEHVVIGNNVTIRSGAVIGDYSVIGDNCVIGVDARVSHSVLWDDTFVGAQALVSGAVLCRRVDVRARATVDSGVVIGNESVVGKGAHIGADVQIFPYKRVEPSATVNSSLIWESTGSRELFTESGITGLVGVDITPELALRVAEAFGSQLKRGGHVVVTRDTSRAARMVKRAIVAGLNAAGMNVRDLRVASPSLCRFTTQKTRSVGGIHVHAVQGDPQSLEIRFFDHNGLDIAPWGQKKIERLYFRQEFRRSFFDEVGEIIYPPRPLEYYSAALNEAIEAVGPRNRWINVVTDMQYGAASLLLPQLAAGWKINLMMLNPIIDVEQVNEATTSQATEHILSRTCELFGATFGVTFDRAAERVSFYVPGVGNLNGDDALHLVLELWCRTRPGVEGAIAVPLTASSAVDAIAAAYGREIVRPGKSRRALAQAVLEGRAVVGGGTFGGYIFGDFFPGFDGVLAVGMVASMLDIAGADLPELIAGLPVYHKRHEAIFCPIDRKGAVMRAVTEATAGLDVNLTEGVRIEDETGWTLVLPDSTEPVVNVWAEGDSDTDAASRVARWSETVQTAIER